MQQGCSKVSNNQESKLHCEIHPENELQILHFAEKSSRKSRMLCYQCLIEFNNKGKNVNQLVDIHSFLIDPKNAIVKIINIDKDQGQHNISKNLDEIDKLLQEFEKTIKNQLSKIKENIQQLRIQIQQIGEEILDELKLNEIVQQIQLLKQMDSCQGTSELNNVENLLNLISQNLNKTYVNINNQAKVNQSEIEKQILDNLQIIKNDLESTYKKCKENLEKLVLYGVIEDIEDFPQIHQQISEGKIIEYQLLYHGTIDGLNGQAYWAKCNLQQNLLTIMTSKNGNKFGGYSPCQINQQRNGYIQDPSLKSFIFQYNKKEIYKLKLKEYAIQCHQSYGPIYGASDIWVELNLQDGKSSNLGYSYDISSHNIIDKANHIFGATTPQLQELKVYKIIFK